MDYRTLLIVFGTVFVAELGDKTQLATMLFAADREVSRWVVFLGSASALVLSSALGVVAGGLVSGLMGPRALSMLAGFGFIAIGAWTLVQAWAIAS
ncbi:MAG: TMEM165/GDT1 family protein [Gammaproteobacteria bacterium]